MNQATRDHDHPIPTIASTAVFRAKVFALQSRRGIANLSSSIRRHPLEPHAEQYPHRLADSHTPLWSDYRPEEQWYQLGKVENLRRAVQQLNGCVLPAGSTFSFWKQIGRATRSRGYVAGRMLQQGCVMPAVGGGLCQLSNALYDLALRSHCEIVERHPHSRPVEGSLMGRDATVAWNYVDLRFRPKLDLRISAHLDVSELVIAFAAKSRPPASSLPVFSTPRDAHFGNTCASCGEISCAHHEAVPKQHTTRTAWLLDSYTPEFNAYLEAHHSPQDALAIPMDGHRWHRPRYAWSSVGFARVQTATLSTLTRALRSRRLSAQGAARQTAMLKSSQELAKRLSSVLSRDVTHVTVSQTLLPFLWLAGVLGGRTVDVLADRLPMFALQNVLDEAFVLHPESETLADFRAPHEVVTAERMAFQHARKIVTPHVAVAELYTDRKVLLGWHRPNLKVEPNTATRNTIVFPGPTVGRKGAFELRAALKGIDAELCVLGAELEGKGFWRGLNLRVGHHWIPQESVLVQPAFVESQPRNLLRALAMGVPVIATAACGLPPQPWLKLVPAGDIAALQSAITAALEQPAARTQVG